MFIPLEDNSTYRYIFEDKGTEVEMYVWIITKSAQGLYPKDESIY